MAMAGPRPLSQLTAEDLPSFGAKAVSLGRMIQWGLPVPEGFAIGVAGSRHELTPPERNAIVRAYAGLAAGESQTPCVVGVDSGPAVAVRSSAPEEDSDRLSFAGQYQSVLGVVGTDALLDAIASCLTGSRSERVLAYRSQMGASAQGMGVIVQLMVPADYAGVCFTRAPGQEDEAVVELIRGLGEDLVAGTRRPAQIRFHRETLDPSFLADHAGLIERFGKDALREVTRLALAAERRFGFALDVEWAHAAGRTFLVQARPITARMQAGDMEQIRREEIERLARLAGPRLVTWTDFSVADMAPHPSPLLQDLLLRFAKYEGGIVRSLRRLGFRQARSDTGKRIFETICGRAYLNVNEFARMMFGELPLVLNAQRLRKEPDRSFDPTAMPTRIDWSDRRVLRLPWTVLRWAAVVPRRFFRLRRRFHRQYVEETYPALQAEAARERSRDLSELALPELWERLSAYVDKLSQELVYYHQLSDYFAFATRALLLRNLRRLYGAAAGEIEAQLTTGLPGNFNTETNLALAKVAAGHLRLEEFVDQYGHRGNPDWDPAAPRWREDTRPLERMLAKIAKAGTDPLGQFERQQRVRAEAEERFSADLRRHWHLRFWRRAILRELRYYQQYSPLREATQSACYLWVELIRRVLLEAGRRLDAADLVFYLSVEDWRGLLAGGDPGPALGRARACRQRLRTARRIYVPHLVRSDHLDAIGRLPALGPAARELRGLGASPGVVRGRARVVAGLEEAQDLEPGEILVATHTDPAWTPLFMVAAGLVLEQGGMLSHGAIVAREQGLPAVINVLNATRLIATGEQLSLDASRGQVVIERAHDPERPSSPPRT